MLHAIVVLDITQAVLSVTNIKQQANSCQQGLHDIAMTYLQVSLLLCRELSVLQRNFVEGVVFLSMVTFIKNLYRKQTIHQLH